MVVLIYDDSLDEGSGPTNRLHSTQIGRHAEANRPKRKDSTTLTRRGEQEGGKPDDEPTCTYCICCLDCVYSLFPTYSRLVITLPLSPKQDQRYTAPTFYQGE